jgi:hypothetical protein
MEKMKAVLENGFDDDMTGFDDRPVFREILEYTNWLLKIEHRVSCNKQRKITMQLHELPAVFWSVVFSAPFPIPLVSLLTVQRWNTVSINTMPCVSIPTSSIDIRVLG